MMLTLVFRTASESCQQWLPAPGFECPTDSITPGCPDVDFLASASKKINVGHQVAQALYYGGTVMPSCPSPAFHHAQALNAR
jgi:hypothetical protein